MFSTTRYRVRSPCVFWCVKSYHVSMRISCKRKLVPEQFLRLAEATGLSNKPGKKVGENYYKRRLEKATISKKEYLYGISPCLAAVEANRRKFYIVYFNDDATNTKSRPQFQKIRAIADRRSIPTKTVSRKRLDDLCGNRPHQNVVMKVGNLSLVPLREDVRSDISESTVVRNRPSIWLILQGIQDPMNMGAILRTAVFLGVDKVVCSDVDSCPLTPAVSKASAGAMESAPVYTTNIKSLLKRKKEENYEILGTVGPRFVPQENMSPVIAASGEFRLEKPSLLVLGNEGKGLSPEIQSLCTKFLTIPARNNRKFSELDSLNVSVATGIILHSLLSNIDR